MGTRNTRAFQTLLKNNFQEILGEKHRRISVDTAWRLYKTAIISSLQHMLEQVSLEEKKDVSLPLSGVGTWKITFRPPRTVAGRESELMKCDLVPHFKFKPSTRFRNYLLRELCEVIVPDAKKPKQKKESEGEVKKTSRTQ